jgi:subtilisin family serine protease
LLIINKQNPLMLHLSKKLSTVLVLAFASGMSFAQKSLINSSVQHFSMPAAVKAGDYIEKTVIIKVKDAFRHICSNTAINDPSFIQLYGSVGGSGLKKKFPAEKSPLKKINEQGQALADLSLIYEFKYTANTDLVKVVNMFNNLGLFEYAEPHFVPRTCYTPNDPSLGMQYAINKIQAPAAWGVNTTTARGDTNVVIGITDTGVEPTHNDLKNNIKHNYADPLGGGDNDGDGYVDNFSGWDVGMNDNDPTWQGSQHGVHVSGIAAASVDNGVGIAGVGFKCKFLPVKIADASGALIAAYEGIQYAAAHGCAVINCSWGGPAGGQFAQDIVTYATINNNSLVVAASGNDGLLTDFYPASLQYVISVANTNNSDVASASTNYGYNIDVCAPGENIYSTWPTNSYSSQTGTSMASPCAAGAAAIIKSFYPSYTALQVGEQLKVTCDNIYSLNTTTYANKLGEGRVNLYKALTQTASPSIVLLSRTDTDGNDDTYLPNDTLKIRGNFINYLAPASNVVVTLAAIGGTSSSVTVLDGTTTLGAMGTMAMADNNADPFTVRIKPTAPLNTVVQFRLTYADAATGYNQTEYFTINVNVDYVNITINDVITTITSTGRIGYRADGQSGGLGFNYMGAGTLLYEAGLMVGTSTAKVSNVVRGVTAGASDADFQSVVRAQRLIPDVASEFDVDGTFSDAPAATGALPIRVHHKAYAWSSPGNRKYVIVEYTIKNTGTVNLNNLYAGIFADWDIDAATYGSNRASFDAVNKMGYAFYTGAAGRYAGIKLLTNTAPVKHYALDNVAGGAGGIDLNAGGFDISEKYTALSTNRTNAGVGGTGVDICDVVSSGPFVVAGGDSIKVAFALIAGDSLSDLQTSAGNAQIMYDGLMATAVSETQDTESSVVIYPNPTSEVSNISLQLSGEAMVDLRLYDITGRNVKTILSERMPVGEHTIVTNVAGLENGIYFYDMRIDNKKYTYKLLIAK